LARQSVRKLIERIVAADILAQNHHMPRAAKCGGMHRMCLPVEMLI
jgi:hypothetical protein